MKVAQDQLIALMVQGMISAVIPKHVTILQVRRNAHDLGKATKFARATSALG
jgi:hypothetical protein